MSTTQQLQNDLDYVASAVRRRELDPGVPSIYALWAVFILVGFALPDFAPQLAGAYWFIVGIGGGLLSWWMAERDGRRRGFMDRETGKRFGMHWGIGGVAYFLTALPMFINGPTNASAAAFLLTTGIIYSLAPACIWCAHCCGVAYWPLSAMPCCCCWLCPTRGLPPA